MITLDTSGVIALLSRREPSHKAVAAIAKGSGGPLVLPVPILAEMTYMIEVRLGRSAVTSFNEKLAEDAFILDCCEGDYTRVGELLARYADLPLPFTDAVVATCAERNGGVLMTLDRRDFEIVARGEGTLSLLP